MLLSEWFAYIFFKHRLRQKLDSLYELEDPWGAELLRDFFVPIIREQMKALDPEVLRAPLLDAGGGEGHYLPPLRDLVSEYHLVEISAKALARAKPRAEGGRSRFVQQSLDEFHPAPDTYGVILLISILTYLGAGRYPQLFARTLSRLWSSLKPGGLILLIHPYYSDEERKTVVAFGETFLRLGGKLNLSEDKRLGKQQFILQAIRKV